VYSQTGASDATEGPSASEEAGEPSEGDAGKPPDDTVEGEFREV